MLCMNINRMVELSSIMEENSASIKSQATFTVAVVASLGCERGEHLSTTIS